MRKSILGKGRALNGPINIKHNIFQLPVTGNILYMVLRATQDLKPLRTGMS